MKKLYVIESFVNDKWIQISFWDGSLEDALTMYQSADLETPPRYIAEDILSHGQYRVRRIESRDEAREIAMIPLGKQHLADEPGIEWLSEEICNLVEVREDGVWKRKLVTLDGIYAARYAASFGKDEDEKPLGRVFSLLFDSGYYGARL